MKIVIIAYTDQGAELSKKLIRGLGKQGYECEGYLFHKYHMDGLSSFTDSDKLVGASFRDNSAIVFVCAAGIAVRKVAPHVNSKETDSAVVVMDDKGLFSISLLSGHLGGANELAALCADITKAQPVITTATDIHRKMAVDLFAKVNNLYISDIRKIKFISSAVLANEKTGLAFSQEHITLENIPDYLICEFSNRDEINAGIMITPFQKEDCFKETLVLVPKQIVVGIGCRKGTPAGVILKRLSEVLSSYHIYKNAVSKICSIALKSEEQGLIIVSQMLQVPFETFSGQMLNSIEGEFNDSEFVKKITGVGNVCERSALAGAGSNGTLLIRKQAGDGVTIAAAIQNITLRF